MLPRFFIQTHIFSSFTSISAQTGLRRADGIVVAVKLRLDSEDAASMITQKRALSEDSLNRHLVKLGVLPITTVSEPVTASSVSQPTGGDEARTIGKRGLSSGAIAGIVVGILAAVGILARHGVSTTTP